MNYFGMFFTFMIPGILLGFMAGTVLRESMRTTRRPAARVRQTAPAQAARSARLFVYDLCDDVAPKGGGKVCREGAKRNVA